MRLINYLLSQEPDISHDSVVLILDHERLISESLPSEAGGFWRHVVSASLEEGLLRVNGNPLRAVLMNLATPGLDVRRVVNCVRQRDAVVPIVGIVTEAGTGSVEAVAGCEILQSPVDWRELQPLIVRKMTAPRAQPVSVFLRDEASRLEQANVLCVRGNSGAVITGEVMRLTSHFLVTEIADPTQMLPPGWQAEEATLTLAGQRAYSGRARVTKVLDTGCSLICEWALQDEWLRPFVEEGSAAVRPVLERLRLLGRIGEVFKAVVADIATILDEVKQCLDRLEPRLPAVPDVLRTQVFATFDEVFARFEHAARAVPDELAAEHHSLVRKHLHPLMMCSPLIHRIYSKPLGFAGDYGMLSLLLGEPENGHSLFARLLNAWLVSNPAGEAYRTRVNVVTDQLRHDALRCHREGRGLRALSIGCGAAPEVARFLGQEDLASAADITLVDFNDETLAEAERATRLAMSRNWRAANIRFIRKSIQQLIHDQGRMSARNLDQYGEVARAGHYDLIYCTGLFDYFSTRVCTRLVRAFLEMLAPGGTLLICNFSPSNPIRGLMKLLLDWDLIHRNENDLISLVPDEAAHNRCVITQSPSGVEIYLRYTRHL